MCPPAKRTSNRHHGLSLGALLDHASSMRLSMLVVLLLALGARLWRLGDANLWWDEALAVWAVRKGLVGATVWTAGDVHPPLYFWALWLWVRLFGESPFAMRTLSAIAGVLTVAVVYALGRLLVRGREPTAGSMSTLPLLAALLTALARFHIWWSQEMRMYVLAGFWGMLSLYFFLRWLHTAAAGGPDRKIWLILYVLCSACSLYTVFLMGALILAQNATMLAVLLWSRDRQRGRLLGGWIVAQLAILVLVAPWVAFSWGRMRTWSVGSPFDPLLFLRLYATLLTTGISVDIQRYTWPMLVPLAFVLLGGGLALVRGIWKGTPWTPMRAGILGLGLTVIAGGAAIYSATLPRGLFYTPRVEARYFLPFAPPFWLLLAWSVATIGRRWRRAGWASSVVLLVLWLMFLPGQYAGRYLHDHLATLCRAIVSQAAQGDVVLLDSGGRYPLFLYDYERAAPGLWRPPMIRIPPGEGELRTEDVEGILAPVAASYRRIWLAEVDVNLSDPQQLARKWLEDRYRPVLVQGYGANTLYLYDPQGLPPTWRPDYDPQHAADMAVGVEGQLLGWELPVETFTSGDTVHLSLLWERLPDAAVQVALYSQGGQLLLRRTAEARAGSAWQRQQFDFPIFPATPAGRYRIVLSPESEGAFILGELTVAGTRPGIRAARPAVRLDVRLGQDIALDGYTLGGVDRTGVLRAAPGDTLVLDLSWRVEHKPERDYTVFTHLLGEAHNPRTDGPVWGQHDSQPLENGYPTTQWLEGDIVWDRHPMVIDAGAPPGEYTIEVGMYTAENGRRLEVVDALGNSLGDRVLLRTPIVVSPR